MLSNKKLFLPFIIIFMNYCVAESYNIRRLGYFSKVSASINSQNILSVEDNLRYSHDCHLGLGYQLDADFINMNLEKMANKDDSIVGYRDIKIQFKYFPIYSTGFGTFIFGVFCVNFSGYAIHAEMSKSKDLDIVNEDK